MNEPRKFACLTGNPDADELVLGWADGTLAPETAQALERHAEACPDCRELLDRQRAVWMVLESWEPEPVSAEFDRKLFAEIDRESSRAGWRRLLEPFTRPVLPFGLRPATPIAVAAAAAAFLFLQPPPDTPVDSARDMAFEEVDIEQVETVLDDIEVLRVLNEQLAAPESPADRKL